MSEAKTGSAFPIDEAQLAPYRTTASGLLAKASDVPPREYQQQLPENAHPLLRVDSLAPQRRDVSVFDLAVKVSNDSRLFSDGVYACLKAIQRGMQIANHLSDLYTVGSNLDNLMDESKRRNGQIPADQQSELEGKQQTASAIALFVSAYYAWKELSRFSPDRIRPLIEDLPWKPVFNYRNPRLAFNSLVFNLGLYLERGAEAQTDLSFVAVTLTYLRAVIDEVLQRKDSFRFAEPYTSVTYRLKGSEFSINGFTANLGNDGVQVEFRKIKFSEIVGNRQAKNFAKRQVERLICYDLERKKNPFCEIGGLSTFVLGAGNPGTGKTLLGAAMATDLEEKCKMVELPYTFIPFPGTVISTFQGGSGERAAEWFDKFEDPSRVTYGLIDDAENVVQNRTDQGVSAGVREVIGEILRRTEGATAIDRGNKAVWLLTNIKEQIDPAVLSRMTERFDIDGAQSVHDFLDQDKLWYDMYSRLDPKFVDLTDPTDYGYFADQKIVQFGKTYEGYDYPKDERICAVVKEAEKQLGRNARKQHEFFARVFKGVQERCPEYHFTSRDIRNIQTSISVRVMDFDLPQLWFDNLGEFFKKDYDTKKMMLTDLMKQSMKGLAFSEVKYQETVRYLDTLAGIRNAGFERSVVQRLEQMRVDDAAIKRFKAA